MNKNLEMTRGDSFGFRFTLEDEDGTLLTVDNAYFSVRQTVDDESYTFQKSLNNGITLQDDGSYQVTVDPTDTSSLDYGLYWYDLELTKDSQVITPMKGKLTIEYDITHTSSSSI